MGNGKNGTKNPYWTKIGAAVNTGLRTYNQVKRVVDRLPNRKPYYPKPDGKSFPRQKPNYKTNSTGRSSGFIRKGRKPRGRANKFARRDIVSTYEITGTTDTNEQVAYVGHHTHPIDLVRFELFAQLIKTMISRCGQSCPTRESLLINNGFAVDDNFSLQYTIGVDQTISNISFIITALTTFMDTVDFFSDPTRPYYSTTQAAVEFGNFYYVPQSTSSIARHQINLKDYSVSMDSKSTFKVQNVTVVAAGDDEHEVNNVPLYGKSYDFSGNTLRERYAISTGTQFQLVADGQSGLFQDSSDVSGGSLPQEPPQIKAWANVKKGGKVRLEPGHIKTSVLTHSVKGKWNKVIANYLSPLISSRVMNGISRVLAYEKMINVGTVAIKLQYEHNMMFSSSSKYYPSNPMKQAFLQLF